jgi:ATP-dependent Clp protease protease subunit
VVILTGHLGADIAAAASAQLMLLDATGDEPIDVRISCPDGDLDAAIALADTIDLVGVTVRACCSGKVGGPALAPVAAAGRRLSQPHCVFVLKDPTVQLGGRADELVALAAAHQRQLDGLHARLASATGQPLERVVADMQRGVVLSAAEALAYGLVHEIATRGGRDPSRG